MHPNGATQVRMIVRVVIEVSPFFAIMVVVCVRHRRARQPLVYSPKVRTLNTMSCHVPPRKSRHTRQSFCGHVGLFITGSSRPRCSSQSTHQAARRSRSTSAGPRRLYPRSMLGGNNITFRKPYQYTILAGYFWIVQAMPHNARHGNPMGLYL